MLDFSNDVTGDAHSSVYQSHTSAKHVLTSVEGGRDLLENYTDFARRLSTLSFSQLEVLSLTAHGYLNKEIAWRRSVAESTIKTYVTVILKKLGLKSRTQAAVQFAIFCERTCNDDRAP